MANYDVHAVLEHSNGIPADNYLNVLHFEVNAPDTLEGTSDDIAAAYTLLAAVLPNTITALTLKWYTPGANPTGPTYTKSYPAVNGTSGPGPAEVALCLSYATSEDPDSSTPRRRGRIYCGPIASPTGERPAPSLRDHILDFGELLASAGNAGNTTWMMYSRMDNTYHKIESIWCDDAWDTQRRRGIAPSTREFRDVQ